MAALHWLRRSPLRTLAAGGAVLLIIAGALYLSIPRAIGTLVSEAPIACLGLEQRARYACWNGAIDAALERDVTSALLQLETFSKAFPDFIQVCHSHAHRIGELAYKEFREGTALSISSAMQLCDFGFYHGFMTEFITQSRDPLEMRAFCTRMEGTEEKGNRGYSRDACYHGIGHGSIERHDPEEWGDPKAVLRQTLALCRSAAENDHDYEKCAGGAYNGMSYGTYGKQILDKQDPFKICRGLSEDEVPTECYGNLAAVVFDLTEHRFLQEGIDLGRSYGDYPHFERAISTFAAMSARQPDSQKASMDACHALPDTLAYHCLWGYVSGLVQSEVPDSREQRAYALCASSLVPEGMRGTCFKAAFYQLADFWSTEKILTSCPLAPKAGRAACETARAAWQDKIEATHPTSASNTI